MKKSVLILLSAIMFMVTSCSVDENSEMYIEDSFTSESLNLSSATIENLKTYNDSIRNSFEVTRGLPADKWGDVVCADLKGAMNGSKYGFWGAVIGAVVYSAIAYYEATLQDNAGEVEGVGRPTKDMICLVAQNLCQVETVNERVQKEFGSIELPLPEINSSVKDVGILHNTALYLLTPEYKDVLTDNLKDNEVSKFVKSENFNLLYNPLILTPESVWDNLSESAYLDSSESKEILELYIDAIRLSKDYDQSYEISCKYLNVVANDQTISEASKYQLYCSMVVGCYSAAYWYEKIESGKIKQ